MIRPIRRAAILGAVLVPFLSTGASAGCGVCPACDPPGSADRAARYTVNTINGRLDQMERSLIETLKKHAGQLTAAIKALGLSIGKIIDAQTQNQAQISRQQEEARIARDYAPSGNSCQTISTTRIAATTGVVSHQNLVALNQSSAGWTASHSTSPSATGTPAAIKALFNAHISRYCTQRDRDGAWNLDCVPDPEYADADVLIGKTLYGRGTLNEQRQQQAAVDLSLMVASPIPPSPPPAVGNDPGAQHAYLRWKSDTARRLVAQDLLLFSVADRMPAADPAAIRELITASGIPLQEPLPPRISRRDFIELEVKRRFENPEWYKSLHKLDGDELQRQALHLSALISALLLRQDERLERLSNGLAALLGSTLDKQPVAVSVPMAPSAR